MIIRAEGGIQLVTLWVASFKGTISLIQSVEFLPTWYLPELRVKKGKPFIIASKVAMLLASKKGTQSMRTPCWNLGHPQACVIWWISHYIMMFPLDSDDHV